MGATLDVPVFRRVVFQNMRHPLTVDEITDKMSKTRRLEWEEDDLGEPGKRSRCR